MYAADPSGPTMDTSDSVGWFIVDMRDLAGQRQQERWVKLQGASPAEVLISSSLAVARDPQQDHSTKEPSEHEQQRRPHSSSNSSAARGGHRTTNAPASPHAARGPITATAVSARLGGEAVVSAGGSSSSGGGSSSSHSYSNDHSHSHSSYHSYSHSGHSSHSSRSHHSRSGSGSGSPEKAGSRLSTSAAESVSDLDALPVGPGADGEDAATFSLAISVKGAAGLSALSSASADVADGGGAGFWLSYSIFGVVVQTNRFERLAPPLRPGGGDRDGQVLEPMLDSFRLRATLQGLCQFLGEAPPLQVSLKPADDAMLSK